MVFPPSLGPGVRRFGNNWRIDRDPNAPKLDLELLKKAWALTHPFWTRRDAWPAWVALALLTAVTFGSSVATAWLARLGGNQLDALAGGNGSVYYQLVLLVFLCAVGTSWLQELFQLPFNLIQQRWRQWLTERFMSQYLANRSYYALNRDMVVDNPDERIAIDIAQFVTYPASVFLGGVGAVSNLAVFGYVLWSFGWYLLPACAAYYALYTVVAVLFAKPQMKLAYEQRRLDGDFRFALVNVRTNSESIAFLRGERVEQRELSHRLGLLIRNATKTVWWNFLLMYWYGLANALNTALPGLLIAPMVIKGTLPLGVFPQAQVAWGQLGAALGFIGNQASMLAYTAALIERLHVLSDHCVGKAREERESQGTRIQVCESDRLACDRLRVETPGGERVLVTDLSFTLEPAGSLLVLGRNGVGKSSVLRALAGLWLRGSGDVRVPPRDQMMFLPQRPYLSLGTLREQVTYPDMNGTFTDGEVRAALERVALHDLEDRFHGFDSVRDWSHVLSPGEQQRVSFARILLRKPRLVILDEATSGLDADGEGLLYRLLRERECGYISVGHRAAVFPFHDTILELTGGGGWTIRSVSPLDLATVDLAAGSSAAAPTPT